MLTIATALISLFLKFSTYETLLQKKINGGTGNSYLRSKICYPRQLKVCGNFNLHLSDELDSLKLDESKLSPSEKERLSFIQKLTTEADEIVKAAGFNIDEDEKDDFEKPIRETQWSGQSNVEENRISSKTFTDILTRPVLAIGDIGSLLFFVTIGRSNHGEGLDVGAVIYAALPFIMGWVTLSPFLGAYTRKATASQGEIAAGLLPAWIVSISAGLALRGYLKGDIPPTPFILVTFAATFSLLFLWRFLFIAAFGETSDEEYKKAGFLEVFKMVGTLIKRW